MTQLEARPLGLFFFSLIVLFSGCGRNEYRKIELSELEPRLKSVSNQITEDFFSLATTPEGLLEFKEKNYITPLIHAAIMSPNGFYAYAPEIMQLNIGKVHSWQLFQAVDKGIITTMRYKLKTEISKNRFVEFKIDINENYKLARIYLYIYEDKENRQNIFRSDL
jgi:hypothetical protein